MATFVERDPKAPFSIVNTPRGRGGCYSVPWIAPLYLDSNLIITESKARQHQLQNFKSLI